MNEWTLVRGLALRIGATADVRLGRALDGWAETHAEWLNLDEVRDWAAARAALAQPCARDDVPHALCIADALARALSLADFDAQLLQLIVANDRLPRVGALAAIAGEHGRDLPALLGEMAGARAEDATRAVRRSAAMRHGLATLRANDRGFVGVELCWPLDRLLDRAAPDDASVRAAMIGPAQPALLSVEDFAHIADLDFLVRLIRGAASSAAKGVNILIHGPPGTGKTELARTMAQAAGLSLHAVGEADDDGDEPSRWDRVTALNLAQRLTASSRDTVLLFDEMEDLIGDTRPTQGDWFSSRQGSKVFVNRLLETNAVPVIWTTNAIGNVDVAILRRMSHVLKLDHPSPAAVARMHARIASEEGVVQQASVADLLARAPEAATVLRVAARAARMAGEAEGPIQPALALVRALRGGEMTTSPEAAIDLDLFETNRPLAPIIDRLGPRASNVSILLTGPPGTGKTALGHHLARAMDRRLVVKRASDLLSCWVGGTEAAVAQAFAEARDRDHILLFDEVDSLLFDRATATRSWETGQVNEMLTWLDSHPLPIIAATNHAHKLDPAALRRFVFKIDLGPLGRDRAGRAFERFFGLPAPGSLAAIVNLTPGDFAAVHRQLPYAPHCGAEDLVDRLAQEAAWRPDSARIGF